MISSYVGENKEFERQYLQGELEVELMPQVRGRKKKNAHAHASQISVNVLKFFFSLLM